MITDKIEKGLKLVESSITQGGVYDADSRTITWNISELASKDGEITVSFTVKVPSVKETTAWTNIATVEYMNDPEDPKNTKDPESSNPVVIEEKVKVVVPFVPTPQKPETDEPEYDPAPEQPTHAAGTDTGDSANLTGLLILLVLAGAGLCTVVIYKRKKHE